MQISIIDYKDYVEFLKDFVQYKKEQNKGWSYNVWARQLDIKDPSLLRKISKGLRSPNQEICKKLNKYFEFSKEQSDFFAVLVELRKINVSDQKRDQILDSFLNSILSKQYKEPQRDIIPMHTTWKHSVLYSFAMLGKGMSLELIKKSSFIDFKEDEILEIINDLLKMGLLDFSDDGQIVAKETEGLIVKRQQDCTSPDYVRLQREATHSFIDALKVNLYQKEIASLSLNIISKIPNSERDNFREDLKNKVLEVLFKYDQMECDDSFELYNIYLGGYSVFSLSQDDDTISSIKPLKKAELDIRVAAVSEFMKQDSKKVHLMSSDQQ